MGICVKISSPKSAAARDFLLLFFFFEVCERVRATQARSSFDLRGYKEHLHFFAEIPSKIDSFSVWKEKTAKMFRAVHPFGT